MEKCCICGNPVEGADPNFLIFCSEACEFEYEHPTDYRQPDPYPDEISDDLDVYYEQYYEEEYPMDGDE